MRTLLGLSLFLLAGCASSPSQIDSAESENRSAFLTATSFDDLLRVDAAFPFGVTRVHRTTGAVLGARWGRHGGPSVTAGVRQVNRFTLPTEATAAPARAQLATAIVPSLPAQHFWGVDGYVDLPFGDLAINTYSTGGAGFTGEVIFFSSSYETVKGRAKVNGYYSGVGIDSNRILYSGLSGLGDTATVSNGLWASDICNAAPCGSSVKLFGWNGFSGPVVTDTDGNVFVAAYKNDGGNTDVVYAVSKSKTASTTPITPAVVAEANNNGTGSLAVGSGWVIAKGYDFDETAPIWAHAYDPVALTPVGATIPRAIVAANPLASLSMFSDPQGHLWIAVEEGASAALVELSPR